jgi:putative oxidoreductase
MSGQTWRGHTFIALAARLYLGGLFLLACWHKILDPRAFAIDIATYQMLPLALVNPLAIVLPWLELVTGALLVLGLRARAASLLTAAMLAMFTAAISVAVARGLDLSCGCFASQGMAEDPISWRTIVRDGAWLLLACYVLHFDQRPLGLDRLLHPAGTAPPRKLT